MSKINWPLTVAVVVMALLIAFLYSVNISKARDLGQWENSDPAVHEWYQGLMQPDNPAASCCAESDAYWADEVHFRDGKTYATITDDRPDEPLGRPHLDIGTEVEVPPEKLKWSDGNPTGHAILFVSRGGYTYCYVQNGGT